MQVLFTGIEHAECYVIRDFRRHFNVKRMSVQQSDMSLHYCDFHLSPISLSPLSFPLTVVLILVLLADWEERGEHTHSSSSLRSESQTFQGSTWVFSQQLAHSRPIFPIHGRTCSLSHTRKYCHGMDAWMDDGWTSFYILDCRSLQALQRSFFALLEQLEDSVPLQSLPSQPTCIFVVAPLGAAWVVPLPCWEV